MPCVAPDHDAPSRVLDRLGFAAFVLDFPDVCRKKEKTRRHGGGAKARVSECRFLRERETRSSIPVIVFLALLSSLSFFQKSDDETAFQIPPRDARARKRKRESRKRKRDDATTTTTTPSSSSFAVVARVIKTLGDARTAKGPQRSSRKGKRKDPQTRERERMNE